MKYIVITGASSGIGRAASLQFASQRKSVIVVARREEKLNALKDEIQQKYPGVEVAVKAFDLTQTELIEDFFDLLSNQYELETWINNAGFGLFSTVEQQDLSTISQMVDINVKALLLFSTLFVKKYHDVPGRSY